MKKSTLLAAAAALSLLAPLQGSAAVDKKTATDIDREIEKVRLDMTKVRRFIHMNPQTANRETETAKIIGSRLASLGLDIKTGVARTGVVALLRGGHSGPTVAVRAGMANSGLSTRASCTRPETTSTPPLSSARPSSWTS
jgi:hypothetical protein